MIKNNTKAKIVLFLLNVFLLNLILIPITTLFGFADTDKIELSEEDKKIFKYYQEPNINMNFEDNRVCIILKSVYNDLEEISFNDFVIVEKVSKICYVDLYTKTFNFERGSKFPLDKCKTHHMFDLVLEEHSKEKVLSVIKLLNSLKIVLISEPIYIYDTINNWKPNDKDYYDQWGLNGANGINIEQAWDITRGSLDVKVGIMEDNIDMSHYELEGRVFNGNFKPSSTANKRHEIGRAHV